jgi:cellulose 1,4-beta-cellobiosidase
LIEQGLAAYKTQYIDVIAKTLTSNANDQVRIAAVIEPDSLPNLVTNLAVPACAEVNRAGYYVDGVTYAIQKLGALPNVAIYLDMAHSG